MPKEDPEAVAVTVSAAAHVLYGHCRNRSFFMLFSGTDVFTGSRILGESAGGPGHVRDLSRSSLVLEGAGVVAGGAGARKNRCGGGDGGGRRVFFLLFLSLFRWCTCG